MRTIAELATQLEQAPLSFGGPLTASERTLVVAALRAVARLQEDNAEQETRTLQGLCVASLTRADLAIASTIEWLKSLHPTRSRTVRLGRLAHARIDIKRVAELLTLPNPVAGDDPAAAEIEAFERWGSR